MNIWLSNGFTRAFQETIDANPSISLRDLYYKLARNTVVPMCRSTMKPFMGTYSGIPCLSICANNCKLYFLKKIVGNLILI